jgi:hypothetical protein
VRHEALPGDVAEASLDRLVEQRSQEIEAQERIERAWAQTAMQHNLRAQAERRRLWIDFHRDLERLHTRLASEHAAKATALLMDEEVSSHAASR